MSDTDSARPRRRLSAAAARVGAAVDRNDVAGVLGAGLVTAGLWQIHPPTALIVLGGLLLALAVAGARRPGG